MKGLFYSPLTPARLAKYAANKKAFLYFATITIPLL